MPTFVHDYQNELKLLDENGNLLVDQAELQSKLGFELTRSWSSISRMMSPHVNKLHISFETPRLPTVPSPHDVSWSKSDNETLFKLAKETNNDWGQIVKSLPGKSLDEIKARYGGVEWNAHEIDLLHEAMKEHETDWSKVSAKIVTKTAGQCWSHWRRSTGEDLDESGGSNEEKGSEGG
jgi:hypothetical protein